MGQLRARRCCCRARSACEQGRWLATDLQPARHLHAGFADLPARLGGKGPVFGCLNLWHGCDRCLAARGSGPCRRPGSYRLINSFVTIFVCLWRFIWHERQGQAGTQIRDGRWQRAAESGTRRHSGPCAPVRRALRTECYHDAAASRFRPSAAISHCHSGCAGRCRPRTRYEPEAHPPGKPRISI